jgi:hypothetical protein
MHKRHFSFLYIIVFLIAGIIITLTSVFSNSLSLKYNSPPPAVIEAGSNVEEASYVIFGVDKNGDGVADEIYAKNGRTGEIEFSGTNASEIISQTLNILTNGGKIFIKNGVYYIDTPIEIPSNVIIEGNQRTILA